MSQPAQAPEGVAAPAGVTPQHSGLLGSAGYLEQVAVSPVDGRALVSGWVVCPPEATPWLEHASGWRLPLTSAFRSLRHDLLSADHLALDRTSACRAGFVVCAPTMGESQVLRLIVTRGEEVQVLGERVSTLLPTDPLRACAVLAALPGEPHWLPERYAQVDWPLLDGLLAQRQRSWAALPVDVHAHGPQLAQPRLSIILVLGERPDAWLPQLLRLAQDDWLREHAELLCVLDDPTQAQTWHAQASTWARLAGLSLRSVWGWAGRGWAGACQLGAEQARAPVLVWMSQDGLPLAPGWAQPLLHALAQQPRLGAVAPRWVRPDGALAQAGLSYRPDPAHPALLRLAPLGAGVAPSAHPGSGWAEVPVLGGAGLMMRTADWQRVGGWPMHYLGDEHAAPDLCLSLRHHGLASACHHDVAWVQLGLPTPVPQPDWAARLAMLDAQRHQWRWGPQLEALAHGGVAHEGDRA